MHFKLNKIISLLLLCGALVKTLPLNVASRELEGDYFEGDIILTKEQRAWLTRSSDGPSSRNVLLAPNYRWPNRLLHFRISSKFSAGDEERIRQAMAAIASRSCVRFAEAPPNSKAYVNILQPNSGCSSNVGYQRRVQALNLARGCMSSSAIQHELLHALGFFHQHSDPKRDNYVEIKYENIKQGYEHNFNKYRAPFVGDFGVGYDYGSVMHYGPYAFSKNGKPTIVALKANAQIGSRNGLSDADFLKLNRLYAC